VKATLFAGEIEIDGVGGLGKKRRGEEEKENNSIAHRPAPSQKSCLACDADCFNG